MPKAYLTIEDFKAGLDGRRLEAAAEAGSLQVLQNAHINRGGEIVKAKKWASKYTLPSGTFGLSAANGTLHVFGSDAEPSGMPLGVTYSRLQNPDGSAMSKVIMTQVFSGTSYVLAEFADGTTHHFNGTNIVTDWYAGLVRTSLSDLTGVATALAADMQQDPDADVVSAGAVITITGKEDNEPLTILASATNGGAIDDQTATVVETQAAGASQPEITTVTLGGTFDPGDKFSIIIGDNTYGSNSATGAVAAVVLTHQNKMYAGSSKDLLFSVVADPGLWRNNVQGSTVNAGAGVIDLSSQSAQDEDITGLGTYQNNLAAFMRNSIQIWSMDANPDVNIQLQILDNTGTRSPKSVKAFGDLDLFYLADSGFRSLRARDSSNSATTTDVGTPIDDIVQAKMDTLTDAQIKAIPAELEPRNGRYMGVLDDTQYVFSFFPDSKIAAWSTYVPGVSIEDFAILNGRLYGRAGDVIYLLGGDNDDEYTDQQVVIETPYLDARTIGHFKYWSGLDVILEGVWAVYVNTNPRQPDEWVQIANLTETSIGQMNLAMHQYAPSIKFRFVHQDASATARLSKLILHYERTWAG